MICSAPQSVIQPRPITETGNKTFIRAMRKWLGTWDKASGINSVLIRGTPRNRFSLSETRAMNSKPKIAAPYGVAAPTAVKQSAAQVMRMKN